MPTWEWTLGAAHADETAAEARRRLAAEQARSAFVDFWFRTTAGQLADGEEARVVVSWDCDERLLSFDAWVQERRIYGADDFLG